MSKETESAMLRPMEPPAEPKVLYPDSQLDAEEGAGDHTRHACGYASRRPHAARSATSRSLLRRHTFFSVVWNCVSTDKSDVLSSTTMGADVARVRLTVQGGSVSGENLDLPINTIYVHREQLLDRDRLDILDIENFHHATVVLNVELFFAADFMDIFQVRGLLSRGKSGSYFCPEVRDSCARAFSMTVWMS